MPSPLNDATTSPVHRVHRLRSSRDIRRVLRDGRRASRGQISCAVALHTPDAPSRIAITTPRSVGKAVARNRAKRRVREAARPWLVAHAGVDAVLTVRSGLDGKSFQDLAADVDAALSEARSKC